MTFKLSHAAAVTAAALGIAVALSACGSRSTRTSAMPSRDSLCADVYNVYECARRVEGHSLPARGDVARHGDTLLIHLDRGERVTLVDRDAGGPDNVFYTYREHLTEIGYHVVDVHYYEGGAHLLLDDDTGARTFVSAPPVVSPDGARLVVASEAGAAGYSPNELQVWRVTDQGLDLEWQLRPDEWGAADPRWQDPGTVHFHKSRWCPEQDGACRQDALLRLTDGEWTVVDPG